MEIYLSCYQYHLYNINGFLREFIAVYYYSPSPLLCLILQLFMNKWLNVMALSFFAVPGIS